MTRARLRDLGFTIGTLPVGEWNAITDVPGVRVGHCTLMYDAPRTARTGVTIIEPRTGAIWENPVFAAFYNLNGNGDFTGTHWIDETGMLTSPIALTNTHQVGLVRDTLVAIQCTQRGVEDFVLPVVAETYDGWLNDINAFHLRAEHVHQALAAARSGMVEEGSVGGGTGMVCHEFKGGIGTSSRIVLTPSGRFTLGVLVQANYGARGLLRVDGVPVGQAIGFDRVPSARPRAAPAGSIIVIVATDAPLLPPQCRRLAQRAVLGLGRVGCIGHDSSGDLVLAFATGNDLPQGAPAPFPVRMLANPHMDALFQAAVEAVEEAVVNALTGAETMIGHKGRVAPALPLDLLGEIMYQFGRG